MLNLIDSVSIFLIPGITDMRKGIDRLCSMIAEKTEENPLSGAYFLFCSRNRRTVKILYWDRNGFCLWQKRLDDDKFWWPKNSEEVSKIKAHELRWLLDGLDPTAVKGHNA